MDLPPEIRLMIAEYALSHPDELCWYWTTPKSDGPKMPAGGFHYDRSGISLNNPLASVCKQLQDETKDIVFKVNSLLFHPWRMNVRRGDRLSLRHIVAAFRYFVENSTPGVLACCHTISISLILGWLDDEPNLLNEWSALVQMVPNIEIRCLPVGWDLTDNYFQGYEEIIMEFMGRGQGLEQRLRDLRYQSFGRALRFYPACPVAQIKKYSQYLSHADVQIAYGWFEHGIGYNS
ncbi:hypothetical protein K491DRAFT_414336 [Lophiostoma macrostomum CBS 122681]|uniref:Uncharacterized protein n=1 Tax=Lophiostoma macrostomum CBS 122681 TaxID=1314788 RepID=A0A6A6T9P8_9PLEO|nr:hypothetical protein K491DRAFT_414336 [Lophiostoma macrostomum CBS 122681]